jgi:solute:Na+ symporter, SSS family
MLAKFDLILVIAYFIIILFIGWRASRKENNQGFLVGNRQIGTASLNATVSASLTGGSSIAAYIALLYLWGFSAFWIFIGASIGLLIFIPFAIKIKKEGDRRKHLTLLDFMYGKFGRVNTTMAAFLLLIVFLLLILGETIIGGKIFSVIIGLPYWLSVIICSLVILIYIYLGGVKSDIKTDLFQYAIFFFLLIIGFSLLKTTSLDKLQLDFFSMGIVQIIAAVIMGILALFVSADVWQKIYAAKSVRSVRRGFFFAAISFLIITFIITIIGLIIKSNFPSVNPNDALIYGFSSLPSGLLGLGLVIILAATMSTIDTALIVSSLFISRDIISKYRKISEDKLVKLTKLFVFAIWLFTTIISIFTSNLVFVFYNSFSFILILAPAVIFSFFFNLKTRAIRYSLIIGILSAIALAFSGNLTSDYAVIPFFVSLIVLGLAQKFVRNK